MHPMKIIWLFHHKEGRSIYAYRPISDGSQEENTQIIVVEKHKKTDAIIEITLD